MAIDIGRRKFIATLSGATVAWPLIARAQQPMPVVGVLHSASREAFTNVMAAFRGGLAETGYNEGENALVEYRWADNQNDRLPALVSDLITRQVAVIAAGGPAAAQAAKVATSTIPVVFAIGADPIRLGLVTSLNRPSANVTGVSFLINVLAPKQLEILHQLVPNAKSIGVLVNPENPYVGVDTNDIQEAARSLDLEVILINARNEADIEAAFAMLASKGAGGLVVVSDATMFDHRALIATLAARRAVPTIYPLRDFVTAGGMVSYGSSVTDAFRLQGVFVGQILKGAKPADLPIQQSTKIELVINLKAAAALGLTIPLPLLGRADEVIE
jgi:putative ABC transport system substrate-binding protein